MYVNIMEAGELRAALEREAENIGHVSVREVISRSKYQPIGRRDFTRADLDAFMPDEDYQTAMAAEFDQRDPDMPVDETDGDKTTHANAKDQQRLVDATLEFVRRTIELQMGKRRFAIFQVQAWRPKGVNVCFAMRVSGRHNEVDDEEDEGDAPGGGRELDDALAPTIQPSERRDLPEPMELPESVQAHIESGYRKLFDAMERGHQVSQVINRDALYGVMVGSQSVARQFVGVSSELRKQISQLTTELERREGVIAELQAMLLSVKVDTAAIALDREMRADPAELKMRQEVATSVIDNIGALGRMALASKLGLDPALIGLLDAITKDDKLLEKLRQPEVSQMFSEPGATEALGQFLDLALEQYRVQRAAKKANPDGAQSA